MNSYKIIGIIFYLASFLGPAFVITETRFDIGGSFVGILLLTAWMFICMFVGRLLIVCGNAKDEADEAAAKKNSLR